MITIALESERVEAGQSLQARIEWSCTDGRPTRLESTLYWFTEGRGDTDGRRIHTETLPIEEGQMTGWTQIDVRVPEDGPISYDGTLLKILWEVRSDLKVDRGSDERAVERVTVQPRSGMR